MKRHGLATGLRGVVDGACAERTAPHTRAARAVATACGRVIRSLCLLSAEDRGRRKQLLRARSRVVVVVNERERPLSKVENRNVSRGAHAKCAEILERGDDARRVD